VTPPSRLPRLLLNLCLRSFPRDHRDRMGGEIRSFLMDEYRDVVVRGNGSRTGFWIRSFWSLLRNGMAARWEARGRSRRRDSRRLDSPGRFSQGRSPVRPLRALGAGAVSLGRSPGFTVASVLTLSLGLGALTIIWSIMQPVLLAPLPYPEPQDLVVVYERSPEPESRSGWVSPLTYRDWRSDLQVLEDLAGYRLSILTRSDGERPTLLRGWAVTSGFFSLMGLDMALGRGLAPGEDEDGADPVVVLSHGYWTRAFGADPQVLGRTMTLDGVPRIIVGVASPELGYPEGGDYWIPLELDYAREFRDFRYLGVVGRIGPGAGPAEAQVELDRLAGAVAAQNPDTNRGWGATSVELKEVQVGRTRPVLLAMAGAVALLLIITVGNLANLTIARWSGRRVDMAIRRAMGAPGSSLAGLCLAENILLAFGGGGVGMGLAYGALRALGNTSLLDLPRISGVHLGGGALTAGFVAALLVGLVLGAIALMASRGSSIVNALRAGGGSRVSTGRSHRVREGVLTAQVALALALLVGGSLLTRSLLELSRVDPGFDPENLMTFSYDLPTSDYSDPAAIEVFERELATRLSNRPGIEAAGMVAPLPMEMGSVPSSWGLPPDIRSPGAGPVMAHMRTATPGYFAAMGIRSLQGRLIDSGDRSDGEAVALVNQAFVDAYLAGHQPLGSRVTAGEAEADDAEWMTIVGVVDNVLFRSLRTGPEPEIYLPSSLLPSTWGHLAVRSNLPRRALVDVVMEALGEVDPALALSDIKAGREIMGSQLRMSRLSALLSGLFALASTLLATVGIVGVLSILVTHRLREIGLRMVLGADSLGIWRYTLVRGFSPVAVGIVLGLAGALAASRLLESQVYGVGTLDPVAFGVPVAGLAVVGLLACVLPGIRAASVDPVRLLKID